MAGELDTGDPHYIAGNWREVLGTRQPVNYPILHFAEIVDTDGVPIKSDRSLLLMANDGSIDWEYGACPYVSSPSRLPENQASDPPKPMSFLERKRLAQNYITMLGMTKHLRAALLGETGPEPLKFVPASRLLHATRFAAHYLLFRADRPIDPEAVPPSLVLAHNSALGALTGMGNGASEQYPAGSRVPQSASSPTVDDIMRITEKKGAFVGEKTVCAATPTMSRHFFRAVLTGANLERIEVPEWFAAALPEDEVPELSRFADSLQSFEVSSTMVIRHDRASAQLVRAELAQQNRKKPSKRNPRRVRGVVTEFINTTQRYAENMMGTQYVINDSLGRGHPPGGYRTFGAAYETHMDPLIDELLAENPDYLPPKVVTRLSRGET
jgi:hypothetical protein